MKCNLNRGLICDGQIQPIGSVCQDYEVQVWCHCDPNEPRMFPPFDPTATPPTVGGSIPTRSHGGDPNKPGDKNTPSGDSTKVPPTNDGSIPTRSNGGDPNKPGDKNTPSGDTTKVPPTNDGSIPTRSNGGDPNKLSGTSDPSTGTTMKPPTIKPTVSRKFSDAYLNYLLK